MRSDRIDKIDLKVFLPACVLLELSVKKLTFRDGDVGDILTILPHHVDYVSSFSTNIITYVSLNDEVGHVVLENGVLVKCAHAVKIVAYRAIIENNLCDVEKQAHELRSSESDIEKEIKNSIRQLEYYMFNHLVNIK